jgi:hypothetical protein
VRYRQIDLVTESGEARVVFVLQNERIGEHTRDVRILIPLGPIEPRESLFGLVAQCIDVGDRIGLGIRILVDQFLESRIGRATVAPDLPGKGYRDVARCPGNLLLRGGQCSLRVASLDLYCRECPVILRSGGL